SLRVEDLAGARGREPGPYNDFSYLRNALAYLRTVNGEKHVVVITEHTFPTGRTEASVQSLQSFWFRQATSARAALHFVHAGGLPGQEMAQGTLVTGKPDPRRLDEMIDRKSQAVTAE